MENNKEFPKGIKWNNPHPNAPDFVKGQISFKVDEFKDYLDTKQRNGWVNIDLKESKKGNLYLELNEYKKAGDNPEVHQGNNQGTSGGSERTSLDPNAEAMLASEEEQPW